MRARVLTPAAVLLAATWSFSRDVPAQSAAAAAPQPPAASAARTSWGDPDLQGVWDYRTITPLERRPEFGDREFYTEQEVAELEGRAARRMDKPPDPNAPASGFVHAEYLTDPGRRLDDAHRTSLIVEPKTGRIPPLTPEAQARQEAARAAAAGAPPGGRVDSYRDRPLYERCITRGLPATILPTLYNNNIRITQAPGYVAIVHEMIHETRVVPLDGSPFTGVRSYLGESRGHWEGDTLVVESRNFNGKAPFRGAGANLKLTERYRRTADDKIDFRLTLEDDTQWTQPWTVAYSMRPADGELYEYACHEGNYGLRNILQNARDEERAAAAHKR
ncbi:MAG TPA: hypothetical protein VHH11_14940 [Gammaproteobacteria bacterium]|jgi:hypothetical protein|nr:hypothetical protein [Gammaproteobacteria bacterium]